MKHFFAIFVILHTTLIANSHGNFFNHLFPSTFNFVPMQVKSQYHTQDENGQYSYGYNSGLSSKNEIKTSDGVTRGRYSYVDPNGQLQNVQYTADAANGFQVSATNHPQPLTNNVPSLKNDPTENVAANPSLHFLFPQFQYRRTIPEPFALPLVYQPISLGYNSLVIPSSSSQFHAQDSSGQYSYGYSNPYSTKTEARTSDGVTRGGYSYVDPNGIVQTVTYIADDTNGFRVAASNLPLQKDFAAPTETPEVQAARRALEEAHNEIKQRLSKAQNN